MKKKCQVVMLPTEKASKLAFLTKKGEEVYKDLRYFHTSMPNHRDIDLTRPQHLYFITDEEIKEGDWCLLMTPKIKLFKCAQVKTEPQLIIKSNIREVHYPNQCKKIIATTDESLEVVSKGIDPVYEKLPRPSNEFLKAYCEAYNSNPITEVNIQYNDIYIDSKTGKPITYWGFETDMLIEEKTIVPQKITKLLVAPDNTITISKVEEKLYTKKEIEKLLFNYGKSIVDDINSVSKISDISIGKSHTKEWIKQNLK